MSRNLEDEIKSLERKLAIKNAYLTVEFRFPKNTKIPEDIQDLVTAELRAAANNLSMDPEDKEPKQSERLSDSDIMILRQVIQSIRAKTGDIATTTQAVVQVPIKERPPSPAKTFDSSIHGVKTAKIVSLESIDTRYRSKVSPEEQVHVISIAEDGFARIASSSGSILRISTEDLEFNE